MAGKKFDEGKPRFDLIDPEFEHALAQVLTLGANKYGADNWRDLEDAEHRYVAACKRHLNRRQRGEPLDRESGLSHTVHAACNLMFLYWMENHNEDTNVRRHESVGNENDSGAGRADPNCDGPNDDQKHQALRAVFDELITILNRSGSYQSIRTCIVHLLDRRGLSQLASTVDSTPDEQLHVS